jgi:hypothetical protein
LVAGSWWKGQITIRGREERLRSAAIVSLGDGHLDFNDSEISVVTVQ